MAGGRSTRAGTPPTSRVVVSLAAIHLHLQHVHAHVRGHIHVHVHVHVCVCTVPCPCTVHIARRASSVTTAVGEVLPSRSADGYDAGALHRVLRL